MDGDDELEYTLLNKRDVLVYQIPPASSSAGHKADDWKKCIWRGRCRIVGRGRDLNIKMLDASSGQLFAQCLIPNGEYEKYVERVIDSSRYFVLKITNGARHAFIGLGFEDRNDAFDFNCTLNDFKSTWVDREKEVEEPKSQEPAKDLSLKEGQKITINLKGMEGRTRRSQENTETSGAGFIGLLAPPPSSSTQSRRQQQQQPAMAAPLAAPPLAAPQAQAAPAMGGSPMAAQDDGFADFEDFQSGSGGAAAPSPAAPAPAMAPAPAFGAQSVAGLGAQFEQLNLRSSPAPQPSPAAPQPAAAAQPAPFLPSASSDPFSGFAPLGGPSQQSMAPVAPPMQATMQAAFSPSQPGHQRTGGSDPFDEFDIFK